MKKRVCPMCGHDEFHAHQLCRVDVIVDGDGEFLENANGDFGDSVYDAEKPYGPFTCEKCGAEYDELDALDEVEDGEGTAAEGKELETVGAKAFVAAANAWDAMTENAKRDWPKFDKWLKLSVVGGDEEAAKAVDLLAAAYAEGAGGAPADQADQAGEAEAPADEAEAEGAPDGEKGDGGEDGETCGLADAIAKAFASALAKAIEDDEDDDEDDDEEDDEDDDLFDDDDEEGDDGDGEGGEDGEEEDDDPLTKMIVDLLTKGHEEHMARRGDVPLDAKTVAGWLERPVGAAPTAAKADGGRPDADDGSDEGDAPEGFENREEFDAFEEFVDDMFAGASIASLRAYAERKAGYAARRKAAEEAAKRKADEEAKRKAGEEAKTGAESELERVLGGLRFRRADGDGPIFGIGVRIVR